MKKSSKSKLFFLLNLRGLVMILIISIIGCNSSTEFKRLPGQSNALKDETSPYLLKHKDNPVDWYAWNDETLAKAKRDNKLLIISIGYASCHWCHVMERESFMDEEIAKIMNEHFINIKVDREERPDVDQIYMNALQLLTGSGGWPLNAFATSEGKPFFATTYLEPTKWKDLLEKVIQMKEENFDDITNGAEQITAGISETEPLKSLSIPKEYPESLLYKINNKLNSELDGEYGGFDFTPKFFYAPALKYLLEQSVHLQNTEVQQNVQKSLINIWKGGIYDHLGGGFARYAVDKKWNIPHFEKMLYDNAQLISVYSKAYKVNPEPIFKEIVANSIQFVLNELKAMEGGYFSSIDAESEGKEGTFYIWEYEELKKNISDAEFKSLAEVLDIKSEGNWESGKNILFTNRDLGDELLKRKYLELKPTLTSLHKLRNKKIKPKIDDKILTSWNALFISGLVDASLAFQEDKYLEMALDLGAFLESNMINESGDLLRISKGDFKIEGFLDDYSYLIRAYIDLYQASFDEKWLLKAKELQQKSIDKFFDSSKGMFYYSGEQGDGLIVRRFEIPDNVMPSPNAITAQNLLILGDLYELDEWMNMAKQMLANISEELGEGGPFMASWAQVYSYLSLGIKEIIIIGPEAREFKNEIQSHLIPNAVFLGGNSEGSLPLLESKLVDDVTMIYVCENRMCKLPVTSVEAALDQIKSN